LCSTESSNICSILNRANGITLGDLHTGNKGVPIRKPVISLLSLNAQVQRQLLFGVIRNIFFNCAPVSGGGL
jgi:hypothetical protein